jgi:hypothetical protein
MPTITDARAAARTLPVDIRAGVEAELASMLSTPPGRPTLAPEADPRPALDPSSVFLIADEEG